MYCAAYELTSVVDCGRFLPVAVKTSCTFVTSPVTEVFDMNSDVVMLGTPAAWSSDLWFFIVKPATVVEFAMSTWWAMYWLRSTWLVRALLICAVMGFWLRPTVAVALYSGVWCFEYR